MPGSNRPHEVATSKFGIYVLSITVALALCALLVSTTGGSWRSVFTAMIDGSVRSPGAWGLTLVARGAVARRCGGNDHRHQGRGLVNIGQEGQLLIGACLLRVRDGPHERAGLVRAVGMGLLAGIVGGAIWAGLAAGMRFWRQVPEVISTLLLVFIAFQVVAYGLTQRWLLLDRNARINHNNTGEPLPGRFAGSAPSTSSATGSASRS